MLRRFDMFKTDTTTPTLENWEPSTTNPDLIADLEPLILTANGLGIVLELKCDDRQRIIWIERVDRGDSSQGRAGELLVDLKEVADNHDYELLAWVSEGNGRLAAYYEELGFTISSEEGSRLILKG